MFETRNIIVFFRYLLYPHTMSVLKGYSKRHVRRLMSAEKKKILMETANHLKNKSLSRHAVDKQNYNYSSTNVDEECLPDSSYKVSDLHITSDFSSEAEVKVEESESSEVDSDIEYDDEMNLGTNSEEEYKDKIFQEKDESLANFQPTYNSNRVLQTSNPKSDDQNVIGSGDEADDTINSLEMRSKKQKNTEFVDDIRQVFLNNIFSVNNTVINDILTVLRKNTDALFPRDARTLLQTPRTTAVTSMSGGQYYHRGLKTVVTEFICNYRKNNLDANAVELVAMVDGADFLKSSENSIWLILCGETLLDDVGIVGAYYGEGKPENSNEFLRMFVDEVKNLIQYGMTIDGAQITVSLKVLLIYHY